MHEFLASPLEQSVDFIPYRDINRNLIKHIFKSKGSSVYINLEFAIIYEVERLVEDAVIGSFETITAQYIKRYDPH